MNCGLVDHPMDPHVTGNLSCLEDKLRSPYTYLQQRGPHEQIIFPSGFFYPSTHHQLITIFSLGEPKLSFRIFFKIAITSCAGYLLLPNKLQQTYEFKATHICYPTVSVGQASGHGLAGSSASRSFAELQYPTVSQVWGRICFHTHVVVGRIWFFTSCQPEGLCLLLVVGQRLISAPATWPFPQAAHKMEACFLKTSKEGRLLARLPLQFHVMISLSSLLYSIAQKQVTCPSHIQAKGITPGCEYEEVGIMRVNLLRLSPHTNISELAGETMQFYLLLSFFCCCCCWSFRATSMAYGISQARGQTGAVTAHLHYSHSNTGS